MFTTGHPFHRGLSGTLPLAVTVALVGAVLPRGGASAASEPLTYDLTSGYRAGQLFQVDVQLKVGGQLKIETDGEARSVPMSVVARLGYREKLLRVPRVAENGPLRAARHYTTAEAVIKIDRGGVKPVLAPPLRWIAVESRAGQTTMYSLNEPLERDDLDLIDVPGNSLLIGALLPNRPVAIGEAWRHSDAVLSALLGLDAVSRSDVKSLLKRVEQGEATVAMAGTLHAAVDGVATDIELKARYLVDLERHTISQFDLAIKEHRAIGHVGPGLNVTARLSLRAKRLTASDDRRLARLTSDQVASAGGERAKLVYHDPSGTYRLRYARNWFVVTEEPKLTVLRLVDRGELVAQCNISTLAPKSPERATQLDTFQHDIRYSLGKRFGQFVKSTEWRDASGGRIYRVAVRGEVDQLPMQWRYYLLASRDGRRLAVSVTVEDALVARLGRADQALVKGLVWLASKHKDTKRTAQRVAEPTR